MRFVVTGGGTGGHIYPALAVADGLQKARPDAEVIYIGSATGLEADIVPRSGIPFHAVQAAGLMGKSLFERLRGGLALVQGTGQAWRLLRRLRPAAVLGTGGYVSAPVVFAAWLLGIPVALQEQNALPGAANRTLARFARLVLLPFPEARRHFGNHPSVRVTGNPVRPDVIAARREPAREALGIAPDETVVFVTGGSRGAASIHAAMAAALGPLLDRPDVVVYYVTGEAYFREVSETVAGLGLASHPRLRLVPYAHNMPELLAAADAAVVRAGAITIAELAVRGVPAVIIPSPNVANDHQVPNARVMSDAGAGVMLLDRDLNGDSLLAALTPLLDDPAVRREMAAKAESVARPEALEHIVKAMLDLAGAGGKGGDSKGAASKAASGKGGGRT